MLTPGRRRAVLPGPEAASLGHHVGQRPSSWHFKLYAGRLRDACNARVDVWHADAIGLCSGYAKQSGVGGISIEPAVGSDTCAARSSPVRRATCSSVRFSRADRRPHAARPFQGVPREQRGRGDQIFFPDEINKEVFAEWQPYREHVQAEDLQRQRPDQAGSVFRGRASAPLVRERPFSSSRRDNRVGGSAFDMAQAVEDPPLLVLRGGRSRRGLRPLRRESTNVRRRRSGSRQFLGALMLRQLHREEPVEQPCVEETNGREHQVGEVAFDDVKIFEERGEPEADPRVEAHTHAAERFRSNASDDHSTNRNANQDARKDVGNQRKALRGVEPA